MTNKINKEFLFTELSIKIATLEMKIDKIIELLNTPEEEYQIAPVMVNLKGQVERFNDTPPQWPNESHTDYLKRIGQYNEASLLEDAFVGSLDSDDEKFLGEFK